MIVALLGILKAGGGYVPLDHRYPPEHLAFIAEDSGAAMILTHSRLAVRLQGTAPLIFLDDEGLVFEGQDEHDLPARHDAGRSRVHHLYVRLDRAPEGRRRRAPRCGESRGLDVAHLPVCR